MKESELSDTVSIFRFFKEVGILDRLKVVLASISAISAGILYPAFGIFFGLVVGVYDEKKLNGFESRLNVACAPFLAVAGGLHLLTFIWNSLLVTTSEKVAINLRKKYMEALLRQEVSFFERSTVEYEPKNFEIFFTSIKDGVGEAFGKLF